ncbi:MAG: type III pantothenate kinase [Verrucomicrobia bacterium]|nr:type III pantothenate kinase [Verrucomicrobiota bacterium]
MTLDLVLDIGNSLIKGGLFNDKTLVDEFALASHPMPKDQLMRHIGGKPIKNVLVSSVNSKAEEPIRNSLEQQNIPYTFLDFAKLKLILDVDEPEQLGHDRIANAYGALARAPLNDCIVVDIGTAITVDFIAKEGRYLGGMIYLGAGLCAKALSDYTDKLPLVSFKKPSSALAKTTETHLQGGIYYGQLGAIERMIAELQMTALSPSSVKVIATGGATRIDDTNVCADKVEFIDDLKELVDFIDPHLTLVGLHEILTELTKKE